MVRFLALRKEVESSRLSSMARFMDKIGLPNNVLAMCLFLCAANFKKSQVVDAWML